MIKELYAVGIFVHIKYTVSGNVKRKTIAPLTPQGDNADISKEPKEVRDLCGEVWTDEAVDAYRGDLESAT